MKQHPVIIERGMAILSLFIPLIGTLYAFVQLKRQGIDPVQVKIFILMYFLTYTGVEVGFHRLFTHKAFKAHGRVRTILAILGSMAFQGPLFFWVGIHRAHHRYSDRPGDPHSPIERGNRFLGRLCGIWHAYAGWLFRYRHEYWLSNSKDLFQDPVALKISRSYFFWLILGLLIPAFMGGVFTRTWHGFFQGFVWGGLVRIFLVQQVNYLINVIGHSFGSRPFSTRDLSANHPWLAPFSLGACWHNHHHAFPRAAHMGLKWWQVDTGGWVIQILEKINLAWDVHRIPKENIQSNKEYA